MPLIQQQNEAALRLGISPRTLRDWRQLPGFPDCTAGYDLEAIHAWRREYERKGAESHETARKLKLGIAAEKLRQMQIRTRREQLELELKEGTLLPRKAVEQTVAVILSSLADWCDQLPDLIAPICPNRRSAERIRERLKAELDARREQLAEDLKAISQTSP